MYAINLIPFNEMMVKIVLQDIIILVPDLTPLYLVFQEILVVIKKQTATNDLFQVVMQISLIVLVALLGQHRLVPFLLSLNIGVVVTNPRE